MTAPDDAQDDERVAALLRAAHERLDERPSLGMRAAILRAAAARATGDALDWADQRPPQAPPRPSSDRPWWRIWVPPLGLSATLLVCVLAIGVFLHREDRVAPSDAQSAGPAAGAAAKEQGIVIMVQPLAPNVKKAPRAEAAPSAPAPTGAPPTAGRPMAAPSATARTAPVLPALQIAPVQVPVPAPTAAPYAGASVPPPAPGIEKAPTKQFMQRATPARESSRDVVDADPQHWLQRIAKLRDAGENDRADDELARFRQAYPDVPVPASALPR
jgi:hypothetical protein